MCIDCKYHIITVYYKEVPSLPYIGPRDTDYNSLLYKEVPSLLSIGLRETILVNY